MYQVHFYYQNLTFQAEGGTLGDVCKVAGLFHDFVCGGRGTCGKCRVLVEADGKKRSVLACITPVDRDYTVYLSPDQQSLQASILTQGQERQGISCNPSLTKEYQTRERLLPGHGGAYLADTPLTVLRKFSALLQNSQTAGITLVREKGRLLDVQAGDTSGTLYGGAVDIGTTTVVLYLYDLNTGIRLATKSSLNRQIRYGADVISRILYSQESAEALHLLHQEILMTLTELLQEAAAEIPDLLPNLYHLVLCGNSTMQHLFLDVSPAGLGVSPFVNLTAAPVRSTAGELGLSAASPACRIEFLPLLGGFVGADTTSVLSTVPHDPKKYLVIDLGTNGEIAAGMHGDFHIASTACGPALEGGNIACGMRGTKGAIEKISLENGEVCLTVIGDGTPAGLCGSGIIDGVAGLLREGLIDAGGRLLTPEELPPASPWAERLQNLEEYNPAFYFHLDPPVYLSQKDVRQIQLAKSAIYAGCVTLLKERGLTPDQVDDMILSGAFGNYIDIDHALEIGLLPPVARDRIHSIGNGAGQGVQLCLLNQEWMTDCLEIPSYTVHVELADSPEFMDEYIMNMNFPG